MHGQQNVKKKKKTNPNISGLQTEKLLFSSKIRLAYFNSVRNLFLTKFCSPEISLTAV